MKDLLIKILIVLIIILLLLLLFGIGMNKLIYNNLIEVEIVANNINKEQRTQIESTDDNTNRTNNKIRFTDSICLAIGYIPANKDADFINKNFNDRKEYENLPVIKLGTSNKFVIIPKEKGGTIKIWTCKMDENYQMVKDEMVAYELDSSGIIVETGEIEYIPTVMIEYIAPSSFECLVPLTFSGEDGSLDLTGNEADVMDISMNMQTDNAVLVESSYLNYAWSYQYYGTVICNNGTIYEFKIEEPNDKININDLSIEMNRENLVKSKYAKKKTESVSESDLKLMKEYISQIEANYEEDELMGLDMGSDYVSVYKDDGNKIALKETGDLNRKNTSAYTDDLLKLIDKYI